MYSIYLNKNLKFTTSKKPADLVYVGTNQQESVFNEVIVNFMDEGFDGKCMYRNTVDIRNSLKQLFTKSYTVIYKVSCSYLQNLAQLFTKSHTVIFKEAVK